MRIQIIHKKRKVQVPQMNLNWLEKSWVTSNTINSASLKKVPLTEKIVSSASLKATKRMMKKRVALTDVRIIKTDSGYKKLVSTKKKKTKQLMSARQSSYKKAWLSDDFDSVKAKSTSTLHKSSYGKEGSENKTDSLIGSSIKGLESALDVELSPSRALHVAKMKERFAGLIAKAQHHTLLEPGAETDMEALQRDKEMLQRRQHEEKAKIKAHRIAAHSKSESEQKKQRQAEREAARITLQKMEQSVVVDDSLQVTKDLEALIGSSLVVSRCHDSRSHHNIWCHMSSDRMKSPLERLGLYIKEEYRLGDENDYAFSEYKDLEEGEIVQ